MTLPAPKYRATCLYRHPGHPHAVMGYESARDLEGARGHGKTFIEKYGPKVSVLIVEEKVLEIMGAPL